MLKYTPGVRGVIWSDFNFHVATSSYGPLLVVPFNVPSSSDSQTLPEGYFYNEPATSEQVSCLMCTLKHSRCLTFFLYKSFIWFAWPKVKYLLIFVAKLRPLTLHGLNLLLDQSKQFQNDWRWSDLSSADQSKVRDILD